MAISCIGLAMATTMLALFLNIASYLIVAKQRVLGHSNFILLRAYVYTEVSGLFSCLTGRLLCAEFWVLYPRIEIGPSRAR